MYHSFTRSLLVSLALVQQGGATFILLGIIIVLLRRRRKQVAGSTKSAGTKFEVPLDIQFPESGYLSGPSDGVDNKLFQ